MALRPFTEVKHHLDGARQEWPCRALLVTEVVAVVRFVNPVAFGDVPAGTVTHGFFWRDRPYDLYRFVAPDLGYRFDVVTEVRILADRVEYLDLLLDVRVGPDGSVRVEDEDEVEEAAAQGLLAPDRRALVERTRDVLLRDHARIVAGAVDLVPAPEAGRGA